MVKGGGSYSREELILNILVKGGQLFEGGKGWLLFKEIQCSMLNPELLTVQ